MSRRLLLVDDDDDIRTIARLTLERLGDWTVSDAASGELELDIAMTAGPFDAVLLDVMMPGLDGPATLERMRAGALPDATPVIFLTAKSQRAERERLQALGVAGTIAKPFDPVALPAEIDRVLAAANHEETAR